MTHKSFARLVLTGAGVLALSGTAHAQAEATVRVDFLADGRCAVSAQGDGFRSKATYMPETPGHPHELRCAMPPVPEGRALTLSVSLPTGRPRPRAAVPALLWSRSGDQWIGTASLSGRPDAIVVDTSSRSPMFWTSLGSGGVVLLGGIVSMRRRRRRRAASIG